MSNPDKKKKASFPKKKLWDCPIFSGKQEEYESWRERVEDWLLYGGDDL
jgi:hypothetical protein